MSEFGGGEVVTDKPVDGEIATEAAAVLGPVKSVNVFEETVGSILRLVKLGLLPPGERLPSERELARRLEVSRPTVREALRSLDSWGTSKRFAVAPAAATSSTGGLSHGRASACPRAGDGR